MRLYVLGGGQLALMMCWESQRVPVHFSVYDPDPSAPAYRCAKRPSDPLEEVDKADAVTFEFENVDISLAERAEKLGKLRPPLAYLKVKKSRIEERALMDSIGVPTVPWRRAANWEEAIKIAESMGRAYVKVPTGGYDGKGQYIYPHEAALIRGLAGELLVEEYVDIRREFSIVAARAENGDVYFYPPAENFYVHGILVWNYAPTKVPEEAYEYVNRILEWGKYVGVIAVEFFEARDGRVLVNEIAPRVHNTGHWTLETDASQFENHVRAVLGLPLRRPRAMAPTAMVNILGVGLGKLPLAELERRGRVYWYYKAEARPRRKMGHLNITAGSVEEAITKAREALRLIYGADFPRLVMRSRPSP
ncbi:MAG: ATP-grasp domain-containing protein [Pyrobaculum arsenaticum]|uniref:N5-carboxyaminoimidazole ribonucleotide synthase n=2 Tax=Pyrobaculum arsenaticum TaxID=121277 RepID=A4WMV4_PYRAR|nr:ATP-grasp domain-containing protein [Pyrobaculum arsenaticum]ABP51721.1 5-(carboxyamino)imidazole ribonucleotide synthase [Pyrobaculum arsenaticum DSM 13514]MCY0890085.1 ATP-grasp domain-containing protein [Pyrobaculum arsenaticum]NYR16041.1 ATP-grasp domain-containing protein [Pyrobaculum arsenaticum]